MLVEVCANSLESALNAQKAGADRIELCTELGVGGITASYGLLKSVRERLSIAVHVLVRPRSGDFTYSEMEFDIMKQDIELCREMGFEGVVSGILRPDLTLDVERTKALKEASGTLHFTFHRAFDWVRDPLQALAQLEAIGVQTILSSGQRKSALEGIDQLAELQHIASKCTIMPGSGIGIKNARLFKEKGFSAIHLSGTKAVQNIPGIPGLSMSATTMLSDNSVLLTDKDIVEQVVAIVK